MKHFLALIVLSFVCQAPAASNNYVAEYLATSQMQFESRDQCREILRALADMATESRSALKAKSYRDYTGRERQWTLKELLNRYFVPEKPLDAKRLFRDLGKKDAKDAIKTVTAKLGDCKEYAGD